MPLIFGNKEITDVNFNGASLDKVLFNNVIVFEKWKKMTGELAKVTSSFSTGSDGLGASSIFKFDKPIRNISGTMTTQGSGGNATYRQFGIDIYCYLDASCSESNVKKIGWQFVTDTNEKTITFGLKNTVIYAIKYTVWCADTNGGSLGTNTCKSAKITSWEQKG